MVAPVQPRTRATPRRSRRSGGTSSASSQTRPEVRLRSGELSADGASGVALPVTNGPGRPQLAAAVDPVRVGLGTDDQVRALLERQQQHGEPGEVLAVPVVAAPSDGLPDPAASAVRTVYLVGIGAGGDPDDPDDAAGQRGLRRAGAALARRARDEPIVALALPVELSDDRLGALVEGLVLGSYAFRVEGSERKGPRLERVDLVGDDVAERQPVLDRALTLAGAAARARDLTNTPSLVKTPQWLADQAAAIAESRGLEVRIRDERELAAEGFGGVVAVGMGSARPPRLIELGYAPPGARRHVVLVGKGITFDSGGLSLKTNEGMVAMKTDMAGGAAVIAAMAALRDLGVRVRVTGLVPAAENLPSGTAQRPSDVIRQYGGRTTEVLNTDAEGRLVLADALAYAVARLRPDAIVDLATLTGAASLGLGRRHAALYATDEALAAGLVAASARSGERVWRMPLVDDYAFALRSEIADSANVATVSTISGGSIVAALFLREFADGIPWAHLDIAGPARSDGDEDEVTKGATGFGARLLLRWLDTLAPPASASR